VFEVDELIEMFSNFFFGRMILDLTALKGYQDSKNLQKLSMSLDVEKIIVLIPDTPDGLSPVFLSSLISIGIYNFTTNSDGINYLLNNPNTYRDVAHLQQLNTNNVASTVNNSTSNDNTTINYISTGTFILGIKNVTDHSGATMLTFMLKNEIARLGKSVIGIEVEKKDFLYFNDKDMISINSGELATEILKHRDKNVIVVDLNNDNNVDICTEILYLIEPSTIKLNKLMLKDRKAFEKLAGKKVVLSQSILSDADVKQFEFETKIKLFFVMPPLDERGKNSEVLINLLNKLGIGSY
jgi:hypothetical protein